MVLSSPAVGNFTTYPWHCLVHRGSLYSLPLSFTRSLMLLYCLVRSFLFQLGWLDSWGYWPRHQFTPITSAHLVTDFQTVGRRIDVVILVLGGQLDVPAAFLPDEKGPGVYW